MTVDANKATVRRYYDEVLNTGHVELLDELAADPYVEHDPLPGQGENREGLKQRVRMLLSAFAPRFTIEDVIAEGDRVVVRWTHAGTHVGDFLGIPASGIAFRIAGIDVHRLQDGRMAEHWHVVDQFALMQQLGVIPQPSPASA
jgi:steroid delta-isomerase-like uncharacterized protein